MSFSLFRAFMRVRMPRVTGVFRKLSLVQHYFQVIDTRISKLLPLNEDQSTIPTFRAAITA